MKNSIAILCCLLTSILFAQEINQLNSKGQKHGLWKGTYDDSKRLRYEGTFENGKEVGEFTFYDNTKAGGIIATRKFNTKDASAYTTFFKDKFKVSEGNVVNKQYEGEWKYYHFKSNAIMTIENYKKGKLEGVRKVFYNDGTIAEEAMYKEGLKNGIYKKYAENGVLLEESNYKKGQLDGKAIFKDADGKLAFTGQYKDGKSVGIFKYYKDDKVVREEDFSKPRNAIAKKTKQN